MRLVLITLLLLVISLKCKAQRVDSTQIIHKMIIGSWTDVDSPNHIMTISYDTVRMDNDCWVYKVKLEKPRGEKRDGQYWFGFSFHNCNEHLMQYMGNIMTDSTYIRFYDGTEDTSMTKSEAFVFKKKNP